MKKLKKLLASPKFTTGAFVVAAALLLFSGVGSARAALQYRSETYSSQLKMYNIGVTLMENDAEVSWRNYNEGSLLGDEWKEHTGVLLKNLKTENDNNAMTPGKQYEEKLCVKNTGSINQYVRASVYTYWVDENGAKRTDLSPDLIRLHLVQDGSWIEDTEASTPERTVLYYTKLLNAGDQTSLFADQIAIDGAIATKVNQTKDENTGAITTEYVYNDAKFVVEVTVDAVQEHNAEAAIWSAWGRKVTVNNSTVTLADGK